MIKDVIRKVVEGNDLTETEMIDAMNVIMAGEAASSQIGSFLTALRMKGETVEEIRGAATVMRQKAAAIHVSSKMVVDTCGTGGDGAGTFNISTAAAFVAAGAGLTVAKHGNRSVSSLSGSADVLQVLGVDVEVETKRVEQCLNEIGIGFLFAPLFHPAMKHVIGARREIGIRTIFNVLGPLTNPVEAPSQVIGVYTDGLTHTLAEVLKGFGAKHVFVVHGCDGLDELTLTGWSHVSELKENDIRDWKLEPETYGLSLCRPEDLKGGHPNENAEIIKKILQGEKGPKRDVTMLNAAAVIVAGGLADHFKRGIELARESIDSGRAREKLEELIRLTRKK
jgi:anthranilate phosphoribosyltransferase